PVGARSATRPRTRGAPQRVWTVATGRRYPVHRTRWNRPVRQQSLPVVRRRGHHAQRIVAERGSSAGAAEDVGLSPTAVAKLITRLEQRIGVRLINRTTRHLALTAEGEIYLDRAREILGAIDAAESEVTSARASPRGHLRVHMFPV